jgi:hypothetical protein
LDWGYLAVLKAKLGHLRVKMGYRLMTYKGKIEVNRGADEVNIIPIIGS